MAYEPVRRLSWYSIVLQRLGAEQHHRLPCWPTGTSSCNCQETETRVVRARHTPWHPLWNHPLGHSGEWATPWSAEAMLDGQHQRVDVPIRARTTHNGLPQKGLEEDHRWIVPYILPTAQRSRDWTKWLVVPHGLVRCLQSNHAHPKLSYYHITVFILGYPLSAGVDGATTDNFTTSFLHFSLFSTDLRDLANSRPVHSLMLSSHLFFYLSCFLPPFHCAMLNGFGQTWRTGDIPQHFSLRLFTMVTRSSCGPIACWILAQTSSLVTRSLYEMRTILCIVSLSHGNEVLQQDTALVVFIKLKDYCRHGCEKHIRHLTVR